MGPLIQIKLPSRSPPLAPSAAQEGPTFLCAWSLELLPSIHPLARSILPLNGSHISPCEAVRTIPPQNQNPKENNTTQTLQRLLPAFGKKTAHFPVGPQASSKLLPPPWEPERRASLLLTLWFCRFSPDGAFAPAVPSASPRTLPRIAQPSPCPAGSDTPPELPPSL